ncbi:hypothetical protein OpiT1DRAFT_05929, partial [Opitutaceae bacterium TAV1]
LSMIRQPACRRAPAFSPPASLQVKHPRRPAPQAQIRPPRRHRQPLPVAATIPHPANGSALAPLAPMHNDPAAVRPDDLRTPLPDIASR